MIFAGNRTGTVEIYNASSLAYLGGIPYNSGPRDALSTGASERHRKSPKKGKGDEAGPAVMELVVDGMKSGRECATVEKGEQLAVMYEDRSVFVVDSVNNEITAYMLGHFKKINSTQWMAKRPGASFVTCSQDMSVFLWQHSGDRWSFTYFDIPQLIDPALRHYRLAGSSESPAGVRGAAVQKSVSALDSAKKHPLSLTALAVDPRHDRFICGSNKGSIWMFDTQLSSLQMHIDLSAFRITEIAFSPTGEFIAVCYCTGLINLYQVAPSFDFALQLEQPLKSSAPPHTLYKSLCIRISLFSVKPNPAEEDGEAFLALSTHNFATVRLHRVFGRAGRMGHDVLMEFSIDEGKIAGFDVHPSHEYVILLSDAGYFYIFHMHLGQLRGKVQIPTSARECKVDPSGLYLFLTVPANDSGTPSQNEVSVSSMSRTGLDSAAPEEGEHRARKLQAYELGTGDLACELANVCGITSFGISSDARHVAVCSDKGMVSVWGISGGMRENIVQVLDCVAVNPEFWTSFPIDLGCVERPESVPESHAEPKTKPEEPQKAPLLSQPVVLRNTMGYPVPTAAPAHVSRRTGAKNTTVAISPLGTTPARMQTQCARNVEAPSTASRPADAQSRFQRKVSYAEVSQGLRRVPKTRHDEGFAAGREEELVGDSLERAEPIFEGSPQFAQKQPQAAEETKIRFQPRAVPDPEDIDRDSVTELVQTPGAINAERLRTIPGGPGQTRTIYAQNRRRGTEVGVRDIKDERVRYGGTHVRGHAQSVPETEGRSVCLRSCLCRRLEIDQRPLY